MWQQWWWRSQLLLPRTSIDLTSPVSLFYPSLLYFPILTAAAAAYAHFLPSLFDEPSVDERQVFCLVAHLLLRMLRKGLKVSLNEHIEELWPLVWLPDSTWVFLHLFPFSKNERGHALLSSPCHSLLMGRALHWFHCHLNNVHQMLKHVWHCLGISITFSAFSLLSPSFTPPILSTPLPLLCCGCDTGTRDAVSTPYLTTLCCLCPLPNTYTLSVFLPD